VNPVLSKVLYSTGNIPVDRKNKDRQALFRGTIDALSRGNAVALFPEGTSYTEPRIMQVKDGAAWAALEYSKWTRENPEHVSQDPLVIVPCAIVYTNKSKYRSYVCSISMFRPYRASQYHDGCHRLSWSLSFFKLLPSAS
jgi:glycerol-3-phosphate O-acyltransferase / dihydroxyacetone phosphate acyltransferase